MENKVFEDFGKFSTNFSKNSQKPKFLILGTEFKGAKNVSHLPENFILRDYNDWLERYEANIEQTNIKIMTVNSKTFLNRQNESLIYLQGDGTHILPRNGYTDIKSVMTVNVNIILNYFCNSALVRGETSLCLKNYDESSSECRQIILENYNKNFCCL